MQSHAPEPPDVASSVMQAMAFTDKRARDRIELQRARVAQELEGLLLNEHPEDRNRKLIRDALENEALRSKMLFEGMHMENEGKRVGFEGQRTADSLRTSEVERGLKDASRRMHEVQTELLPRELDIKEKSVLSSARHGDEANAIRREALRLASETTGDAKRNLMLMSDILENPDYSDRDKGTMLLRLNREIENAVVGSKGAAGIKDSANRRLAEWAAQTKDEELKKVVLSHIKPTNETGQDQPLMYLKKK